MLDGRLWWRISLIESLPRNRLGRIGFSIKMKLSTIPTFAISCSKGVGASIRHERQRSAPAAAVWPYLFRRTNLIYGLELIALVLFFDDWAPPLRISCCWACLDSNNCPAALVRGDSNTEVIALLVDRPGA